MNTGKGEYEYPSAEIWERMLRDNDEMVAAAMLRTVRELKAEDPGNLHRYAS
jgi:hypothetical protein